MSTVNSLKKYTAEVFMISEICHYITLFHLKMSKHFSTKVRMFVVLFYLVPYNSKVKSCIRTIPSPHCLASRYTVYTRTWTDAL